MKKTNLLSIILTILFTVTIFNISYADGTAEPSDDDIYVVADYTSGETQSWGGALNACYSSSSRGAFYDVDNDTTLNGAAASVRWNDLGGSTTISGSARARKALYALNENKTGNSMNFDKYNYVNAWIYSHEESAQRIVVKMYFDKNNDYSGSESAGHCYLDKQVVVDWTGWKIVSLPISEMRIRPNDSDKGAHYAWGNGSIKIYATGFEANSTANCDKIDLNIDSVWYSKEAPADFALGSVLSSDGSSLDNADNVSITSKNITLEFNRILKTDNAQEYVSVYSGDNDTPDTNYTLTADRNKINIEYSDLLNESTDYRIEISKNLASAEKVSLGEDKVISFKTGERGFYVSQCRFKFGDDIITTLPESGTVFANAKVMNLTDETKDALAIIAKYDLETNEMTELTQKNISVDAETETYVEVSIDSDSYIGSSVELIILDGLDTLKNYNGVTTVKYGTESPKSSVSDAASSNFELAISGSLLTLYCSSDTDTQGEYVIKVTDESDNLLHLRTIVFPNDSKSYTFKISAGDESENIYIAIMNKGYDEPLKYTAYYLSENDALLITEKINTAQSQDNLQSIIKDNVQKLGISKDYDKYSLYAEQLYLKRPFKSVEDIKSLIESSHADLASLNACPWDELSEFLSGKENITANSSKYREFTNKYVSERNKISRNVMLKSPFETFGEFAAALDKAVTEESNESSSSKGSGGGGGSRGSSPVTPSKGVNIPITNPDSDKPDTPKSDTDNDTNKSDEIFTDVTADHWAKDAVYSLVKNGAVSVGDDKKFRPDDSITREEFVKLTVTLFKYENKNTDMTFDDVNNDSWFKDYVDIAVSNGLINGLSDREFGAGRNISRQDIAVILYRMITERNYDFAASDVPAFEDNGEISDYALDAVNNLHKMNIIKGSDDKFMPSESATRAEAVQMIYNIYSKISK